ncbi:MAG: DUF2914 domain-containing protein [Candidatus Paceibacterota bacterium]
MFFIEPIRNFYGRYEHQVSSLFLILGFIIDALTIKRADKLWENLWILGYIILIGIFILLLHREEATSGKEQNSERTHFWYLVILQFCFGGVLSANLVLYFRSADIFVVWPFVLILAVAFWANESLKKHHARLSFQISLFFLSVYSFTIFLVPVILHKIGTGVFLLSGLVSLIFITIFILVLFHFAKEKFTESKKLILLILGIFVTVNFLYFINLIPPIPLSLKDAGAFHLIQKNKDGNYLVQYEKNGWKRYFQLYPDFNVLPGAAVFAYSAIFSPKGLNLTIVHEWQHYNETLKEWVTESKVNLLVVGGRDGGFRTYSMRIDLAPGKWRVSVKTAQGQNIGHLRFNLVSTNIEPALIEIIK